MSERRVVITGIGIITPLGNDLNVFWQNLLAGKSGIGPVTRFDATNFDSKIGGEVKDFNAEGFMPAKETRRTDRFTQYAIGAARKAVADSKMELSKEDLNRVGVIVGSGIGGMETIEEQAGILLKKGPQRVSPFMIPMLIVNMASGYISMLLGVKGPNLSRNRRAGRRKAVPLTHHETVALGVERPASALGLVISRAHCAHRTEAGITELRDGGFAAAGNHDIGIVVHNGAGSFTQRVRGGGASGNDGKVRALDAEQHRDVAAGHVDDQHGNHKRRHALRALLQKDASLLLDRFHSTDARANDDANAVQVFFGEFHLRVGHGLSRCAYGVLRESVSPTSFFRRHEFFGIEILSLAADFAIEVGGIEPGHGTDAGLAREQVLPKAIQVIAQRGKDSDPRDA